MINNEVLNNAQILVLGLGGLGGYVTESLVRLGFKNITAVDGDTFNESNLNRQLYSTLDTLGRNKALVAKDRALTINKDINFIAIDKFFDESNADELILASSIIIDALDNASSRLLLEDIANKYNMPVIHGAINSYLGQIAVIMPGDHLLHSLYKRNNNSEVMNLVTSCSIVANLEVNEAVKVLENKPHLNKNEVLTIDLETLDFNVIKIIKINE